MRILRLYVSIRKEMLIWFFISLVFFLAGMGLYTALNWVKYSARHAYHAYIKDDLYDSYNDTYVLSEELRFYENGAHSYICDRTAKRKKVLRDIFWVAGVNREDSLLCFAKDGYRGFLNRHTGEVVVPANRYRKAWLFSEGKAAVMDEDSTIKFINTTGKEVINTRSKYVPLPQGRGIQFRNGQCALMGPNGSWGLMDKSGRWTVVPQYDDILTTGMGFWVVDSCGKKGVLNGNLQQVLPPLYKDIRVCSYGIEALDEDYVRHLLSHDGREVCPFTYTDIRNLVYTARIEEEDCAMEISPYKVYQTTYSEDDSVRVGLLSPGGYPVTPPSYTSIRAVNANVFRCFYGGEDVDEGLSVLVNDKGQVIDGPITASP